MIDIYCNVFIFNIVQINLKLQLIQISNILYVQWELKMHTLINREINKYHAYRVLVREGKINTLK